MRLRSHVGPYGPAGFHLSPLSNADCPAYSSPSQPVKILNCELKNILTARAHDVKFSLNSAESDIIIQNLEHLLTFTGIVGTI